MEWRLTRPFSLSGVRLVQGRKDHRIVCDQLRITPEGGKSCTTHYQLILSLRQFVFYTVINTTVFMNQKYKEYLQSEEWRELKIDLLQIRGCKCERCGRGRSPERLHVHHKTYARIFNELPSDLVILCGRCHLGEHIDIVPKKVLRSYGIIKPKKKRSKKIKREKKKLKLVVRKKKKLTIYQKALIHFNNKIQHKYLR